MLIGVSGRKGSGKSTLASYLVERYGYKERAFADPIKQAVLLLFQLDPRQLDGVAKEVVDHRYSLSPRRMMQLVGTDMFRDMVSKTFWVDYFKTWYSAQTTQDIVVPDVRFQNEVDVIRDLGGIVVRLVRETTSSDDHVSETEVDRLTGIDIEIQNDTSEVSDLWTSFERERILHQV